MKKGQLSSKNLNAAEAIARYLKKHKSMSLVEFKRQFCKARGWRGWTNNYSFGSVTVEAHEYYASEHNYNSTEWFLRNHNLMTRETVNGFVLFVATQKLVRSQVKNWFNE